jgi:hypothetical protein
MTNKNEIFKKTYRFPYYDPTVTDAPQSLELLDKISVLNDLVPVKK